MSSRANNHERPTWPTTARAMNNNGDGSLPPGTQKPKGGFQAAKECWLMMLASYPNLSGADLAVAIVIAKHMNSSSGKAWPSLETIAKLTHRDRSSAWRSLRRLYL